MDHLLPLRYPDWKMPLRRQEYDESQRGPKEFFLLTAHRHNETWHGGMPLHGPIGEEWIFETVFSYLSVHLPGWSWLQTAILFGQARQISSLRQLVVGWIQKSSQVIKFICWSARRSSHERSMNDFFSRNDGFMIWFYKTDNMPHMFAPLKAFTLPGQDPLNLASWICPALGSCQRSLYQRSIFKIFKRGTYRLRIYGLSRHDFACGKEDPKIPFLIHRWSKGHNVKPAWQCSWRPELEWVVR